MNKKVIPAVDKARMKMIIDLIMGRSKARILQDSVVKGQMSMDQVAEDSVPELHATEDNGVEEPVAEDRVAEESVVRDRVATTKMIRKYKMMEEIVMFESGRK
jgi:hypothetical protein